MTVKLSQIIKSTVLLSIVFIAAVPFADLIVSLFIRAKQDPGSSSDYSSNEMLAGIVSETLRALITSYLYSTTIEKGSSMTHGMKYGLLYSALIASLYIVLGGFYFQLKDPLMFVVVDSSILFLQGIASGLILYYVFREKGNTR